MQSILDAQKTSVPGSLIAVDGSTEKVHGIAATVLGVEITVNVVTNSFHIVILALAY